VIHTLLHDIDVPRSNFGIYGIESLRKVEGDTVAQFRKLSGINDIDKAFLIKTGRRPNDAEKRYQYRIDEGKERLSRIYFVNWAAYAAQHILLKHDPIMPCSKEVTDLTTYVFGHKLPEFLLHRIGYLVRYRMYSFNEGYYALNVWQIMQVVASLDAINSDRSSSSISLLFNKIYKRDPLEVETRICKKLDLTKEPDEIEHEIKSFVQVIWETNFRAPRGPR